MKRIITFAIVLVLLASIYIQPQIAHAAPTWDVDSGGTLSTSLKAWYNLEDVTDEFSTNDLTNNNSVTFPAAKINNGASVTRGSSQTLTIANSLGIDGGNISISVFFKTPASLPASGEYHMIATQEAQTSNTLYWIALQNNGGTQTWNFMRSRWGTADEGVTATPTINANTWYHLVLTYNGTSVEGFVNTTSQGTAAASGAGAAGGIDQFAIGRWGGHASHHATGIMDLAGVWSKVLSTTEIADLYNTGTGNAYREQAGGGTPTPTIQIIWWFDE